VHFSQTPLLIYAWVEGQVAIQKLLYNEKLPLQLEQLTAEIQAEQFNGQFSHFPADGYIAAGH
jgi:hypothetical protein